MVKLEKSGQGRGAFRVTTGAERGAELTETEIGAGTVTEVTGIGTGASTGTEAGTVAGAEVTGTDAEAEMLLASGTGNEN